MTNINNKHLHTAEDGITRCWWGNDHLDYRNYHDEEWGRPVADDFQLFEKICLEGFQSGLSWLTILRKRENFRDAFAAFDFNKIADFDADNVSQLLQNAGIIRHRGKIEATINNAGRAQELVKREGSLAAFLWRYEPDIKQLAKPQTASTSAQSTALSKDLKKLGWKFDGPTMVYAFMQAMGLINDHVDDCVIRAKVERARRNFRRPGR